MSSEDRGAAVAAAAAAACDPDVLAHNRELKKQSSDDEGLERELAAFLVKSGMVAREME